MDIIKIKKQAGKILKILDELTGEKGLSLNKINERSGIKVSKSPLSSLHKKILPAIIEEEIKNVFELEDIFIKFSNNIRKTIYLEFEDMITNLEALKSEIEFVEKNGEKETAYEVWNRCKVKNIEESFSHLLGIEGLYYVYINHPNILKTDLVKIPMLIRKSSTTRAFEVYLALGAEGSEHMGVIYLIENIIVFDLVSEDFSKNQVDSSFIIHALNRGKGTAFKRAAGYYFLINDSNEYYIHSFKGDKSVDDDEDQDELNFSGIPMDSILYGKIYLEKVEDEMNYENYRRKEIQLVSFSKAKFHEEAIGEYLKYDLKWKAKSFLHRGVLKLLRFFSKKAKANPAHKSDWFIRKALKQED